MTGIIYPLLSLASIMFFAWLGHFLADRRNRRAVGWGVAGAILPPLLIILFFLKPLADEPDEAEAAEAS